MLEKETNDFIGYCNVSNFKEKSIESLSVRLAEFNSFIKSRRIRKITSITYSHLMTFVADYREPSIHIKKARVWSLRQFFHFMKLNGWIENNIDLRGLIIIMMIGLLGLRTGTLVVLNIQDVDLSAGLVRIKEKGNIKRLIVLPDIICTGLRTYLEDRGQIRGPLFNSVRGKRISPRTLQDVFRSVADSVGVEKHLHTHLFTHTAATLMHRTVAYSGKEPETAGFVCGGPTV